MGGATGSSQSETGCQSGANWIQPPTTDRTARTATGAVIENGPSPECSCSVTCSCTNAEGSPRKTMK